MSRKFKLVSLVLILIVVIAGIGVATWVQQQSERGYTLIDFDEKRCFNDEKELTSIGPRLSGTNEEYEGAVYIRDQFEEAGLANVHIEEYETLFYEVNSAEVSLVQYLPLGNIPNPLSDPVSFSHKMDFVVQGYSGSYDWTSYWDDLEIVNIGDGEDDSQWESAQGHAAIVTSDIGIAGNTELFFKADEFDVGALVIHNTQYGEKHGYLPISKTTILPEGKTSYPDIPFFMVSKAVGEEILAGVASNMKLRIDFDVTREERALRVVLGDVKGRGNPDKYVMIGAHHDTVYNGIGAVDNTVGAVTIIELARQLIKHKPDKTIRLVTWGGEEEGLFGSCLYFDAHKGDIIENCMMYLNYDMNNVELKRGNVLPISVASNKTIKRMEDITRQLQKKHSEFIKYDVQFGYNDLKGGGSDQWIFANNDINVAACWGSGSWEYHTYLDNIDHVNPESQSLSGRIFGSYALYLAG
jgi:hypothetical protein